MGHVPCALCNVQRARRECPVVKRDICPQCCGNSREVTLACPLDCPHLVEGRQRDKRLATDPGPRPHLDIPADEATFRKHNVQVALIGTSLATAAEKMAGVVDSHLQEVLENRIAFHRPAAEDLALSPVAEELLEAFEVDFAKVAMLLNEQGRAKFWSNQVMLESFALLRTMHHFTNNHKPLGRAYLQHLQETFARPMGRDASNEVENIE